MRATIIVVIIVALTSLSTISIAAGEKQLVLHHFATLPAGLGAEGLAIHNGHFYVGAFSFTASEGTVLVFDKDGSITGKFTIPGLPQVGQIAFTDDHTLVTVAGNLATGHGSLLKINIESGMITTVASGFKLPNGIVVDKHDNLYVTDLLTGIVSRITPSGTVSVFTSSPLLAPALIPGAGLTLGSNDLVFDKKQSALYITNVGKGTVVKAEVGDDGTAGTISNFASVPTPDGVAFDIKGNLYVTSPFTNSVWIVSGNGSASQLQLDMRNESLTNPSNVAFQGRELFITNLSIMGTGKISVVTVEFLGLRIKS